MAQHQQVATLPSDNFTSLQLPRRGHNDLFREDPHNLTSGLLSILSPYGGEYTTTDVHTPKVTLFRRDRLF